MSLTPAAITYASVTTAAATTVVLPFDWNAVVQAGVVIVMGYLAYKTSVQGRIIETIHTNTNSLSARLEAEAKNAGMALGYEKGRAEGVEKAATLMRGQLQGAPSTWTPTPPSALPPAPTDKPTEVEVVNNEKPVPVQITAGAINSITDAVKQSARPKLRKRRAK